jgi:hypothetical protein
MSEETEFLFRGEKNLRMGKQILVNGGRAAFLSANSQKGG